MEYYSEIKRNESPRLAATGKNSKNIVMRKRRQAQRSSFCMILFI
jgi:hypothetical protein